MFRWLFDLIRPKPFKIIAQYPPDSGDPLDDPAVLDGVLRACRTGNVVIGNRDDDGNWVIQELPKDPTP